jgi:magnesium-transporting ATPase (P-type)
MYFTRDGEAIVSKETSEVYQQMEENDEPNNHKDNPDPFLFTNAKIMTGHGKAVVCAVGDNTMAARSRKKTDLVMQEEKTHLEGLLDIFGEGVKVFAYQACIWCVVS